MKVTDFFDLLWETFGLAAMDGTDNTGERNEVWDSVVVTAAGSMGGGFTGETGFEWSNGAVVKTTGLTTGGDGREGWTGSKGNCCAMVSDV